MAGVCLDDCSHHQKKEVSHSSGHDCCKQMKSSENDKKTIDECASDHCLKSANLENTAITIESRLKPNELGSSINVVSPTLLIADLSANSQIFTQRDAWIQSAKVPLYIAFKKLLLP